jgi:6-pyruvoyltetrahydropterin/6-carboxytetrahydropterin synthase
VPTWSDEKNLRIFGQDHSLDGVGYNLRVEIKTLVPEGSVADWKVVTKSYVQQLLDHQFLNDDLEAFREGPVTIERIGQYFWEFLKRKLELSDLTIRVYEGPFRYVEVGVEGLALTQIYTVNCVHQHWNPALTVAENKELYGQCSGIHGHQYTIEVSLAGSVDPESQLLISRQEFDQIVRKKIVEPLHGSFLNDIVGNTSGEKIALYIFAQLQNDFQPHSLHRVTVRETRKNSFFVGAEPF